MKAKLRAQIKKRDKHRCRFCGKPESPTVKLTIDHIIPISRGGHPEKKANLLACCFACNQKKANRTPEEAGMVIITTGYDYTPPGRMADALDDMLESIIVNHGRKKRRKAKRKERKQLVKAILRDGVDQYLCVRIECVELRESGRPGGFHTQHYHDHHMRKQ